MTASTTPQLGRLGSRLLARSLEHGDGDAVKALEWARRQYGADLLQVAFGGGVAAPVLMGSGGVWFVAGVAVAVLNLLRAVNPFVYYDSVRGELRRLAEERRSL